MSEAVHGSNATYSTAVKLSAVHVHKAWSLPHYNQAGDSASAAVSMALGMLSKGGLIHSAVSVERIG